MENFLLWGFYFLTFYAFLPGLVSRTFGFRVFKRGRAEREIALTFDDGPDPVYTPLLLDLLKRYDAKATFFVVGNHAERHPEILKRMHDEGHIIGIHNYVHKTNWLMRPRTVKKQIQRTSEIIRNATGSDSVYYRPPWGIVNLFDFSNLGYMQIILWSALFGDWRKRVGAERLKKRIMKKLRPGEILLLHDCGDTFGADKEAPVHMLAALEPVLAAGQAKGYKFVHIAEMIAITDEAKKSNAGSDAKAESRKGGSKPKLGLMKRIAVSCWMGWERLFHVVFRVKSVADGSIFHYRVIKYRGATLELSDGNRIADKDDVVELHFDNGMLLQLMTNSRSMMQLAVMLIREVKKSMPQLAERLALDADAQLVKGLYGVSLMNRGVENFGFDVHKLPKGLFDFSSRLYLKLLLRVLNPSGKQRLSEQGARMEPRIMAMSMDTFWQRFSSDDERTAPNRAAARDFDGRLHGNGTNELHSAAYDNANAAREFTP
ncbi:polysaccharide deacetylase family protein [Paenibacillus sacheonensis]|uniref:Polysaccharide deacetylase family protein n=1 Tax=Paenibacillus sacheonensis TaxID=742054 RepID=A0A7X4YQ94_9BACL|nr:polysaccharide deacetylase family protein [Paenibacillus sacheonensis]MBM7565473.1 peptidoglycan/xylan/chitin deacetylase (PgdA/CDA1 family) [Paenibacillus sacheonensis]NBC69599.1 polysaccharide deacetylase family protein [Paenibacillus sacheonensis]